MQQPSPPSRAAVEEDPFDFDIKFPPDFIFPDLDDDDGADVFADGQAATNHHHHQQQFAEAQGGEEDQQLALVYHGQMFVFDSVQPHKVETILSVLNGQEMAPQTAKPQPTHLVRPIVVPENFDRPAALMRYRKKRRSIKSIVKADYSAHKEVALRMKRSRGKFVASANSEHTFCTNCGVRSDATPMMRRAQDGSVTFCNACGLMWAKTRKLRKTTNDSCGSQGGR